MPNTLNSRSRRPVADDVDDDPYADDDNDGVPNGEDDDDNNDGVPDGNDNNADNDSNPIGKSLGVKTTQVEGEAAYVADAETFVKGITRHLSKSVRADVLDTLQGDEFRQVIREEVLRLTKPLHTLVKGMDSRQDTFMENMEEWADAVDEANDAIKKSLGDLGDVSTLSKSLSVLGETANATIEAAKTTPAVQTPAAPAPASADVPLDSLLSKAAITGSAASANTPPATDSQRQEIGKLVAEAETLQESLQKSVPGLGPMIDLISGSHPIASDDVEKLRAGIALVKGQ